jgi:hypothetical protein
MRYAPSTWQSKAVDNSVDKSMKSLPRGDPWRFRRPNPGNAMDLFDLGS